MISPYLMGWCVVGVARGDTEFPLLDTSLELSGIVSKSSLCLQSTCKMHNFVGNPIYSVSPDKKTDTHTHKKKA